MASVSRSGAGVVTVTEAVSGEFLYKVRPGSQASVVFGTVQGPELEARVDDQRIVIRGRQGEEVVDIIKVPTARLTASAPAFLSTMTGRSAWEHRSLPSCWACSFEDLKGLAGCESCVTNGAVRCAGRDALSLVQQEKRWVPGLPPDTSG